MPIIVALHGMLNSIDYSPLFVIGYCAICFSAQTGTTPLIQAITCNYVHIAGTILEYNADVNKADNVTNELAHYSFINQLIWPK